jgi:hypothetical protein
VVRVVGEIVAGISVREDGEWTAVERKPFSDVAEPLRRDS